MTWLMLSRSCSDNTNSWRQTQVYPNHTYFPAIKMMWLIPHVFLSYFPHDSPHSYLLQWRTCSSGVESGMFESFLSLLPQRQDRNGYLYVDWFIKGIAATRTRNFLTSLLSLPLSSLFVSSHQSGVFCTVYCLSPHYYILLMICLPSINFQVSKHRKLLQFLHQWNSGHLEHSTNFRVLYNILHINTWSNTMHIQSTDICSEFSEIRTLDTHLLDLISSLWYPCNYITLQV